jgi:hypothetical protein
MLHQGYVFPVDSSLAQYVIPLYQNPLFRIQLYRTACIICVRMYYRRDLR